jgi:hypothetical protein
MRQLSAYPRAELLLDDPAGAIFLMSASGISADSSSRKCFATTESPSSGKVLHEPGEDVLVVFRRQSDLEDVVDGGKRRNPSLPLFAPSAETDEQRLSAPSFDEAEDPQEVTEGLREVVHLLLDPLPDEVPAALVLSASLELQLLEPVWLPSAADAIASDVLVPEANRDEIDLWRCEAEAEAFVPRRIASVVQESGGPTARSVPGPAKDSDPDTGTSTAEDCDFELHPWPCSL